LSKLYNWFEERHTTIAKWLAVIFTVFFAGLFLVLALNRLFLPYEISSMEGSIILHAARIYNHQQLYVAPSIVFVNWLYQPFYYYVTAAIMNVGGISYFSGRFVSILATLLTSGIIFFVIRQITSRSLWHSGIGVGLFLATYALTGFSFDIARIDALLCFLLVSAMAVIVLRNDTISVIASAVLMALAIFTKQQAFIYLVPITLWLWLRKRSQAVLFVATVVALFALGTILLYDANGRWYFHYVYTIPRAKAKLYGYGRLPFVFSEYVFSGWGVSSIAILFWFFYKRRDHTLRSKEGFLFMVWVIAIVQISLHLGDQMSSQNIALPFAAITAILLPIALKELATVTVFAPAVSWLLIIQFAAFLYNPFKENLTVITQAHKAAVAQYNSYLRSTKGNVLLWGQQLIPELAGKKSYANNLAVQDAYMPADTTSNRLADDWKRAYSSKLFDVILLDDNNWWIERSLPNYQKISVLNFDSLSIDPKAASALGLPKYVLVPREK
jgi:hypothetical protein